MKNTKTFFKKLMSVLMSALILVSCLTVPAAASGIGIADPSTFDAATVFGNILNVVFTVVQAIGIIAVIIAIVLLVKELALEKESRNFNKTLIMGIGGLILAVLPVILKSVGLLV